MYMSVCNSAFAQQISSYKQDASRGYYILLVVSSSHWLVSRFGLDKASYRFGLFR